MERFERANEFVGTAAGIRLGGSLARNRPRPNRGTQNATNAGQAAANATPTPLVHKNSLDYAGDTHVYRIIGPDSTTYKIGESSQGTRLRDGASIRAEQQARRLTRETGERYRTEIRKIFPDKASARAYETRLIERFRRMYGQDTLPGNKTNR